MKTPPSFIRRSPLLKHHRPPKINKHNTLLPSLPGQKHILAVQRVMRNPTLIQLIYRPCGGAMQLRQPKPRLTPLEAFWQSLQLVLERSHSYPWFYQLGQYGLTRFGRGSVNGPRAVEERELCSLDGITLFIGTQLIGQTTGQWPMGGVEFRGPSSWGSIVAVEEDGDVACEEPLDVHTDGRGTRWGVVRSGRVGVRLV